MVVLTPPQLAARVQFVKEEQRSEKKREKTKSEALCFGFERRKKANAVFGNSLWLLPETKLSGLCKKKKPKLKPSVSGFNLERRSDEVNER